MHEGPVTQKEKSTMKMRAPLGEGVSKGWEDSRQFSAEEVLAGMKELGISVEGVEATEALPNHEGVLVLIYLRAPGSKTGYAYMLKGRHGPRNTSDETAIERVDYAAGDSDDFYHAEVIAEYVGDKWVKK